MDIELKLYYYTYRKTKSGGYRHFYKSKETNQTAIMTCSYLLSKDMRNTKVLYDMTMMDYSESEKELK